MRIAVACDERFYRPINKGFIALIDALCEENIESSPLRFVKVHEDALLGKADDVQRGLAIATHIFPELAPWTDLDRLLIPGWEKKFAIPLAARRLMIGERE